VPSVVHGRRSLNTNALAPLGTRALLPQYRLGNRELENWELVNWELEPIYQLPIYQLPIYRLLSPRLPAAIIPQSAQFVKPALSTIHTLSTTCPHPTDMSLP